jgi:N-methylhydantoinase A/oxoprolinase/acetone carboxylase beta subunit
MSLRLGIDTGGTFTDAVLVDEAHAIIASCKSLTTRHDLSVGIRAAVAGLPQDALAAVGLVALSTTLSTNSVVEGRGAPVGVLLPGYQQQQVARSGLLQIFEPSQVVTLAGGHDAAGKECAALDEALARQTILALAGRVAAFAVSALFGVRNPEHELRLRDMVGALCGKPVTCGHELASDLDAPRRALTVALNARMVPIIHELIDAVRAILAESRIDAPLMMVKGDGSLVSTALAMKQPLTTVLSGPAASVIGACALSGAGNAIVADMGGTTTDIAIVSNGQPELGSKGVRIGSWKPMVEAVRVFSIGLGGDSEVHFSGVSGIEVGPRRVIPMSLLGHQSPAIVDQLRAQLQRRPSRRDNRFACRLEYNKVMLAACSEAEWRAWEMLRDGPRELETLVHSDRSASRAMARLQRLGLVVYSGFTPSDAAHVLGHCRHWNVAAAQLGALLWARMMRHVFGLGDWKDGDAEGPSRSVFECVSRQLSETLIEAGLHQRGQLDGAREHGLTRLLSNLIFRSREEAALPPGLPNSPLFHVGFAADHPLVAVGAPAALFFPAAAEHLGVQLRLPSMGEVANAYGAVMGHIVQRVHVTVTQPVPGQFVLHSSQLPMAFTDLEAALEKAQQLAAEQARALAVGAGATSVVVGFSRLENHVRHDIDGELFLETRVTATAVGPPSCGGLRQAEPLRDSTAATR